VIDYSKYENNTNILNLLNGVVKLICLSKCQIPMDRKILFDLNLIDSFGQKLSNADYKESLANRKSIYPFIHNLTSFLQSLVENADKAHLKEKLLALESWILL
jgi:hypothetical protein